MRTIRTLLESAHLHEAEKATQLLADEDIGMMIHKPGLDRRVFILFRISAFVNTVKQLEQQSTGGTEIARIKKLRNDLWWNLERYILAILIASPEDSDSYGECWGAHTIERTAANKGYGPAIYEIGLAVIGSLVPDRGSVSAAAKGVWGKFLNRADVEASSLDDIDNPVTPDPKDDCQVYFKNPKDRTMVDYAYKLTDASRKAILNSVVPTLIKRKDDALRELNFTMDDDTAYTIARGFFNSKYQF